MIDLDKYPNIRGYLDTIDMFTPKTLEEFFAACGYKDSEELKQLVENRRGELYQFLRDRSTTKKKVIYEKEHLSFKYTAHGVEIEGDKLDKIFKRLEQALEQARIIVRYSLEQMQVHAPASSGPETLDRNNVFDKILLTHFRLNKNEKQSDALVRINRVLALTKQGLDTRVRISSSTLSTKSAAGYVAPRTQDASEEHPFHNRLPDDVLTDEDRKENRLYRGSIHIDFLQASESGICTAKDAMSLLEVARIIIHEATHKFANTLDKAYCHDIQPYFKLSAAEALINADSYAFAAVSLYTQKVLTSDSAELRQKKAD